MTFTCNSSLWSFWRFCCLTVALLSFSLFADADKPAGNFPVSTPLCKVIFSPDGGIVSITPSYRQSSSKSVSWPFNAIDSSPIFNVNSGHDYPQFTSSIYSARSDSVTVVCFKNDLFELSYTLHSWDFCIDVLLRYAGTTSGVADSSQQIRFEVARGHAVHSDIHSVLIQKHREIYIEKHSPDSAVISGTRWFGSRNRFWTLLVNKPAYNSSFSITGRSFQLSAAASAPCSLRIYAGPVEYHELRKAGHECTQLLYPLWFWMRWLSIGLLYIFNTILSLWENTVLSIVFLSICVKIILAPLYRIASKWQSDVNRQKSILEPRLKEIRQKYKGEEQTRQTLAAHKELGISPMYSLKSLSSAAIQIPVFFAAYHMLSEHIALQGVSISWIKDLSLPDQLISLPFSLFFFGDHINLLPFLMTAITIASSYVHTDPSLSATLYKKQRTSLYWLAAIFFLLLYTSPAGMLIYWTMNNLLAFLGAVTTAIFHQRKNRQAA